MAAVLGGTQSLHTNGYDEALSLPTEEAARIALRTQQIIAFESGVADTVDPLGGSFFVEQLTNDVEAAAWELIARIDELGGSVAAIEAGFIQDEIARSAYLHQRAVENKDRIIVGVNQFTQEEQVRPPVFRVDDSIRQVQTDKLAMLRNQRNPARCDHILQDLNDKASSGENIMPVVLEAVENDCTLGEIADTLREVFGEHR